MAFFDLGCVAFTKHNWVIVILLTRWLSVSVNPYCLSFPWKCSIFIDSGWFTALTLLTDRRLDCEFLSLHTEEGISLNICACYPSALHTNKHTAKNFKRQISPLSVNQFICAKHDRKQPYHLIFGCDLKLSTNFSFQQLWVHHTDSSAVKNIIMCKLLLRNIFYGTIHIISR